VDGVDYLVIKRPARLRVMFGQVELDAEGLDVPPEQLDDIVILHRMAEEKAALPWDAVRHADDLSS